MMSADSCRGTCRVEVAFEADWSESAMWWHDLLWGLWNGTTAWVVLIVHACGGWSQYPFFNTARNGDWYDLGFLLGAGSPFLGFFGSSRRKSSRAS